MARALRERHGCGRSCSGDPAKRELAEAVVAAAGGAALLSPPTTIADLVALARGAAMMVSGDTGPTHIAAAVGTPLVGISARRGPSATGRGGRRHPVSRDAICANATTCAAAGASMCLLDIEDGRSARRGRAPARGRARLVFDLARAAAHARSGLVFGAAAFWFAQPTLGSIALGAAIAAVGEALRIWAAGHLNKSREVTASGPYRWFAHPLYVGSSIMGVGLAVASASVVAAVLIAVYLVMTSTAAIRTEEAYLRGRFGDAYDATTAGDAPAAARRFSFAQRDREPRVSRHRRIRGRCVAARA